MLDIQKWKGNPWLVLTILSFGFFMTQLDLQIVNIAIPNLMETLHASINEALWVLNIYHIGACRFFNYGRPFWRSIWYTTIVFNWNCPFYHL
ncbi:hypothetical protein Bcoa_1542 [Heyndrickxia coagulans 36D1]|uniref:Major facilitator superfamily (MFS) profile domain-containing protein n=1 Tax=Heyndrickxia coagulans 36D1 TaxID=345219 RepID=G2TIQ4_HEYCO|nr:hypothetical protein Bcoa_1542 [Heyndrickxia coagulans 36D1]